MISIEVLGLIALKIRVDVRLRIGEHAPKPF